MSNNLPPLQKQRTPIHAMLVSRLLKVFSPGVPRMMRWKSKRKQSKGLRCQKLNNQTSPFLVIRRFYDSFGPVTRCATHTETEQLSICCWTQVFGQVELCYDATRPEEETGLRLTNITLTRGTESYIWVMGKGRKPRTIGLGQATAIAVRKYLNRERGHSESPYAFLSRGDEPLSVRMLQQFLHRLGNLAKVEDVHPHRFRHTFAVDQLLNGVSDFVLMQLLGHTTLESQQKSTSVR